MKARTTLLSTLFAFTLLGCSSLTLTGSGSRDGANISEYEGVYFSDDADYDEKLDQRFLPVLARTLERNGLKVVTERSGPKVLVCKLGIKSLGVGKCLRISLWDGSEITFGAELCSGVLALSSSDPTYDRLFAKTLDRLDGELLRNRQTNR